MLRAASSVSVNLAAPGPIGGTTPGAVSATTLSATSTFTPAQVAGIVGTTTNNSAQAGSIGEFVTSTVAVGGAVALTSGVTSTITSISLTAGDWDVMGAVDHSIAGTTSITQINSGVSLTAATLAAQTGGGGLGTDPTVTLSYAAMVPGAGIVQGTSLVRVLLSSTTTVYLVAQDAFTLSTISAYGTIRARRVR